MFTFSLTAEPSHEITGQGHICLREDRGEKFVNKMKLLPDYDI